MLSTVLHRTLRPTAVLLAIMLSAAIVLATAVAPIYVSVDSAQGYGDVVVSSKWGQAHYTPSIPLITEQGTSTSNPNGETTVTVEQKFTGASVKAYTVDGEGAAGIDIEYVSKRVVPADSLLVHLFVEWNAGPTLQDTDYEITWKQKSMSVNWDGKITLRQTGNGEAMYRVFTSEISDDLSNIGSADIPIKINPNETPPKQYRWYHELQGPNSLTISDSIGNADCPVTHQDGSDVSLRACLRSRFQSSKHQVRHRKVYECFA